MRSRPHLQFALPALLALTACQCQPAPEVFPCNGTADCPNDLVCSNGLCREPIDAGRAADAAVDGASTQDAAVADVHSPTSDGAAIRDGAATNDRIAPDQPRVDVATGDDHTVAADASGADGSAADAAPPIHWWNDWWPWRQRLTFDNSAQDEDLTDFTVLVQLDPSRFPFGDTSSDGTDVRFVASDDETLLNHEIEQWTSSSMADGIAWIWVRVPKIDARSNSGYIWMYYGNLAPPPPPSTYDSWAPRYRAVWHLDGNSLDSTSHRNDGTDHLVGAASGKIGGGYDFDGRESYVAVATDVSLNRIFDSPTGGAAGGTVMAWIRPRGAGEGGYGRIVNKAHGHLTDDGWTFEMRAGGSCGTSIGFEQAYSASNGDWCAQAGLAAYSAWHLVAVMFDDAAPVSGPLFWVDGALSSANTLTAPGGQPLLDDGNDLHIGSLASTMDYTFDGVIDEVRLVDAVLSPSWLAAEYLNMTDAFITFGVAQPRP